MKEHYQVRWAAVTTSNAGRAVGHYHDRPLRPHSAIHRSTISERNAAVGYGAQPRDKSNPSVGYYDPTRAKHGL